MEITEEDAIVLADVGVGKRPQLNLEDARSLRDKLDILIQERSAVHDAVNHWKHSVIHQPSNGPTVDIKRRRMSSVAGDATCEHSCAHHGAVMNPRIWSSLPKELLQLVFARLPLYQIFRLTCLSKEWNQSIFGRVATQAQGKMFAKIRNRNEVSMHLYDIKSNRWHELQLSSPNQVPCQAMSSDGGLVCIISRHALSMPVRIVVCNPLTRAWRELPRHALSMIQPNVVRLEMNATTKSYKVLVVACGEDNVIHAMVYDSTTGFWSCTNLFSDLIYGYWYDWTEEEDGERDLVSQIDVQGPCVYDCSRGKLLHVGHAGDGLQRYALVKDHLIVLQDTIVQNANGRFRHRVLSEYQACKQGRSNWVLLRVHELPSAFTQCSNYEMLLFACRGLLLVSTDNDMSGAFKQELVWVYDLDTREWHEPVAPPERFFIELDTMMCELQWDAVP